MLQGVCVFFDIKMTEWVMRCDDSRGVWDCGVTYMDDCKIGNIVMMR